MKKFLAVVLIAVLVTAAAMPVFAAEDYYIGSAWWNVDESTFQIGAEWDQAASSTKYRVTFYCTDSSGTERKLSAQTLGTTSMDATSLFKYVGSYWFEVYPVKGGQGLTVLSDMLEVDREYLDQIAQNRYAREKGTSATVPAYEWVRQPNGTWQLKKNGLTVTNKWEQVGGFWYLFDASGRMLKGWQQKDGKYYYLNVNGGVGGYPEGACMLNTITPDGYRVDASGAWVQ